MWKQILLSGIYCWLAMMHFTKFLRVGFGLVVAVQLASEFSRPAMGQTLGSPNEVLIKRQSNEVQVLFSNQLFSASQVHGPWIQITNVFSPHRISAPIGQQFFRSGNVQLQSIFSSQSVVELQVSGPFQQHFNLAYAGMPDGIFPPRREKPYFNATVTLGALTRPVEMRVRGNSSLQECPFPKMKLKISSNNRQGTPFFDAREIKIGTHCAEGGDGQIGRLRDERTAYRETTVYEAMNLLGFLTPRVRRLKITYGDTSPTNTAEARWEVRREGMILDDQEVVAERLGGRALDDSEITTLTNANFSPQLINDLRFFHTLVGNWDYGLSVDGKNLWNTDVISFTNGTYLPLAGDFDLASWVTAEVRSNVPWDYRPELPKLDREMHYQLEQIKQGGGLQLFLISSNRFMLGLTPLQSHLANAVVDLGGKSNALAHITAFFQALTNAAVSKP